MAHFLKKKKKKKKKILQKKKKKFLKQTCTRNMDFYDDSTHSNRNHTYFQHLNQSNGTYGYRKAFNNYFLLLPNQTNDHSFFTGEKKRKNNSHKVGQVIKGPLVAKYGTIGPVNAIVTIIIFFFIIWVHLLAIYIYIRFLSDFLVQRAHRESYPKGDL